MLRKFGVASFLRGALHGHRGGISPAQRDGFRERRRSLPRSARASRWARASIRSPWRSRLFMKVMQTVRACDQEPAPQRARGRVEKRSAGRRSKKYCVGVIVRRPKSRRTRDDRARRARSDGRPGRRQLEHAGVRLTTDGGAHPKSQLNIMTRASSGSWRRPGSAGRWPKISCLVDLDWSAEPAARDAAGNRHCRNQGHQSTPHRVAKIVERFGAWMRRSSSILLSASSFSCVESTPELTYLSRSVSVGDFVRRMSSGSDPDADPIEVTSFLRNRPPPIAPWLNLDGSA